MMNAIPGLTQVKNIPVPTDPINDGRLPQELFEIIQIPPDRHPFKYENLWETELDWGRLAADKDKLYVGSREFINHFRPSPTTGNPYICLI